VGFVGVLEVEPLHTVHVYGAREKPALRSRLLHSICLDLAATCTVVSDIADVNEPTAQGGLFPGTVDVDGVERFDLKYPDEAHNAETLMVDPVNGDIYIVVKSGDGESPIFRAAAPLDPDNDIVMEYVLTLTFGEGALPGDTETTAGDISRDGSLIAIRTYDHAFMWRRIPGATIAEALQTEPCPVPLKDEGQGEALGFSSGGGRDYYTLGEGSMVGISFYNSPW